MLQQMNKKLCVTLHNITVLKFLYGIRAEKSLKSIHPFYCVLQMATITAPSTDSTHSLIITINAATTINEKLIPSTFPQWRAQFEALLIGYDLIDFVTGTHKCPAVDAQNFTASKAANSHRIRQDKLILHAILASTSTIITPLLSTYKTSNEAWTTLTRLYACKSRTRVMQLKEDLTLSTPG